MSRQAWGKGRALLESLRLRDVQIAKCYHMHPQSEEEVVQHGLQVWMNGGTNPTWETLLNALETVEIDAQQLKEELRSNTGDSHWLMVACVWCGEEGCMCHCVCVCVCVYVCVCVCEEGCVCHCVCVRRGVCVTVSV